MKNKYISQSESLSYDSLSHLIDNKILAIHIPNYLDNEKCMMLSKKINQSIDLLETPVGGIYESNVDSFWNTLESNELRNNYFDNAIRSIRHSRELTEFLFPTDKIRLELDEIWPKGTNLMRINNRAMLFGMARRWKEGSEALPHQDILRREMGDKDKSSHQISQLGINIYLACPKEGGELELWDHIIQDHAYEKFSNEGIKGSYGFNRESIPPSSISIMPKMGDLLIINSLNIHAVRKVIKGQRLTLSGFIGYWGPNQPLKLWS